jgi:predicted amidophosphoribosyltransferase
MNYDQSQIVTKDLRPCEACQYEARAQDKFCRRCGSKLDGSRKGDEVGSREPQPMQNVSSALVAAVGAGVTTEAGKIHGQMARRMISALISIPIWLIIILLSPLEAYRSARSVAR